MCLHCEEKVSNCSIKGYGSSRLAKEGTIYAYTKAILGKTFLSSHSCHLVKKYLLRIKLLRVLCSLCLHC